jgi:raffinose/stachyose/melibiose transport system permease protein
MVIDKGKQNFYFLLFLFPACFLCILFIIYPFFLGIFSAFTDTDWKETTPDHCISFKNFTDMFDPGKDQYFLPRFNTHYLFKDTYELPFTIDAKTYHEILLKRIKTREERELLEKAYHEEENGDYSLDKEYREFALFDRLMAVTGGDEERYSVILENIREAAFSRQPLTDPSVLFQQYYNVFKVKKILSTYMYKRELIPGVVGFTLLYTLINLFFVTPLALFLAVALDTKIPGKMFLRAFFFLPCVLSGITVSFLSYFTTEVVFPFITGGAGSWLDHPDRAPLLVAFTGAWRHCGFLVLIFLFGLKTIPAEYRETAALDGASSLLIFFRITGPLLVPFLLLGICWLIASSLTVFDLVFGLTRTTGYTTNTASYLLDIYNNAYTSNRVGYAMAKALVLSLLCGGLAYTQYLTMKKKAADR